MSARQYAETYVTSSASTDCTDADPRTSEILQIVAKETSVPVDRLTPQTPIVSLDIASLDMVQAIFALETRFDVEIPVVANETGGEFGTVGDLVRHVITAIDAKAAG